MTGNQQSESANAPSPARTPTASVATREPVRQSRIEQGCTPTSSDTNDQTNNFTDTTTPSNPIDRAKRFQVMAEIYVRVSSGYAITALGLYVLAAVYGVTPIAVPVALRDALLLIGVGIGLVAGNDVFQLLLRMSRGALAAVAPSRRQGQKKLGADHDTDHAGGTDN